MTPRTYGRPWVIGRAPAHDNPISLDEAYLKLKALSGAADQLRLEQQQN